MNLNFVKQVIEAGGSLHPITIPSLHTEGTGLTNPSIFVKDGKIQLNLRHVQYTLWHNENLQKFPNQWGPLAYLNPEDDITLRTVNYQCELDPNTLQVKSFNRIDTSKLDVTPIWEFIGLEDARMVEWENKTYLCGVRRDTKTDGEGRMELSEIQDGKEIARYRIEPPTPSYCEKNWMPILDMPYHYVKWTNVTEVVKVDPKTNSSETIVLKDKFINGLPDLRGGSQVLKWKNYRFCITHEVDLTRSETGQKNGKYYHRFVIWDEDWNIVRLTEPFHFLTARIEFCCGMVIHQDNLLITFGFQDNASYLLKMPISILENYIYGK